MNTRAISKILATVIVLGGLGLLAYYQPAFTLGWFVGAFLVNIAIKYGDRIHGFADNLNKDKDN